MATTNASKKDQNAIKHLNFISKKMDEALGKQKSYYEAIHTVCVLVAYHAMRYHDNQGANIIISKIGNGTRKQGVVNWFGMFCGFKWDDKANAFTTEVNSEYIHANMVNAKKKPWHECMKAERVVKPMDINEDVIRLVNHINKIRQRTVEGDVGTVSDANLKNLIVALGIPVMETIEVKAVQSDAA